MDMQMLQKWLPVGESVIGLLGVPQRQWLNAHAGSLPMYLGGERGQAALLMFLEDFNAFVTDQQKISQKPVQQSQAA